MFYKEFLSFVLFLLLPISKGAIPGTFFWRPRLGVDLAMPTTESPLTAFHPNKKNIQAGLVVLLDGYDIMTSILGLLRSSEFARDDDTINPASSLYYSGLYRWTWRTLDLLPHWLRGNFHDALGVWNHRFKYMEAEVPEWMRKALPWVPKESWDTERADFIKFKKLAETAYTPFYRFPSKTFDNFQSFLPDSLADFVFSSASRDLFDMSQEDLKITLKRKEELQKRLQGKGTETNGTSPDSQKRVGK